MCLDIRAWHLSKSSLGNDIFRVIPDFVELRDIERQCQSQHPMIPVTTSVTTSYDTLLSIKDTCKFNYELLQKMMSDVIVFTHTHMCTPAHMKYFILWNCSTKWKWLSLFYRLMGYAKIILLTYLKLRS